MDVLLVGSMGSLMQRLVDKLDKEKHRIFILTEEGKEVKSYRRVFETYRFSYEDVCTQEVFASVKPDVTLFFGAYDTNFQWEDKKNVITKYTSALLNMLMAFALQESGRFIYLSSDVVFSGIETDEEMHLINHTGKNPKAQSVSMGEKMCEDYKLMADIDIVVLRLDHLYGIPTYSKEMDGVCAQMCMEALNTGEIALSGGHTIMSAEEKTSPDIIAGKGLEVEQEKMFSLLALPDAVDFIYQVIAAEHCERFLYQVSGENPVSQMQIAELIQKSLKKGGSDAISLAEKSKEDENSIRLAVSSFKTEFKMRIMNPPEKMIPELAEYMQKNYSRFSVIEDKRDNFLSRLKSGFQELMHAMVPFIENVVCFIPFFMLNNRTAESDFFRNLDFYLLYVLLFAIVHGQQQAIFSSLLAIAGYCFRQMYERSGFDIMLDYNTYVWMVQLLILGFTVGYMRDQLHSIRDENASEVEFLKKQVSDISEINSSNVRVKEILSDHLINQNDSMGKIYEITSQLSRYQPVEVLFYAAEVLSEIMRSGDVAVYSVANRSYARLFSATSMKARKLGNSINYTEMTEMYEALLEHRVYINKSLNENYPLMANAIYSEENMEMILMVWDIPWERMTLGQADMLAITGFLIQDAVLRANRYMSALAEQRYIQGTHILEAEAFGELVDAFLRARSRNLTSCTLLTIDTGMVSQDEANAVFAKLVRQTDYLGKAADGSLQVLLANTDAVGAAFVQQRFEESGFTCRIEESMRE